LEDVSDCHRPNYSIRRLYLCDRIIEKGVIIMLINVIDKGKKVEIKFQGRINMTQVVEITKKDAQKLAAILVKNNGKFETE